MTALQRSERRLAELRASREEWVAEHGATSPALDDEVIEAALDVGRQMAALTRCWLPTLPPLPGYYVRSSQR